MNQHAPMQHNPQPETTTVQANTKGKGGTRHSRAKELAADRGPVESGKRRAQKRLRTPREER